MAALQAKPGDWTCPNCRDLNFASRQRCRKCDSPRPVAQQARPGDWHCTGCAELNFSSRQQCRKCGKDKPKAVAAAAPSPVVAGPRPGDWKCVCTEVNFGSRVICRKCGAARPSNPAAAAETKKELCVVCMAAPADTAVVVCGHVCMCGACARLVHDCPLCRVAFTPDQLLKVFVNGVN